MRKGTVAFANFICTYGDAGAFLDFPEISLPAFTNDTLVRKYGSNYFHFYDVKVSVLDNVNGEPVVGVGGHFVKTVKLTREQIFNHSAGIVKSHRSMESSPSAYFLLILNTHRLVYFAETAHAPDLKSFEATVSHFIKKIRADWINKRFNEAQDRKTSKKYLEEKLPRPVLKVVPLAEAERISEYLSRFSSIQTVKFRLIKPNHETDASEVVSAVRARFGQLLPDRLDIVASRSAGLDKPEVVQAVEEAAETANTVIELKGEDADGAHIRGNNDEFALTIELDNPDTTDIGLRNQLFNKYKSLLAAGKIKIGAGLDHVGDAIKQIATML